MPWKYEADDSNVAVIVDPQFRGDLDEMARLHPVWIVDTAENQGQIETSWRGGAEKGLFEVNRYPVENPDARQANLLMIMGSLDDHYSSYSLRVHGIKPDDSTTNLLREEGFQITLATDDGFDAARIPGVREGMLGRSKQ